MSSPVHRRARLGQADGSEVELVVRGNELYATYETPDGFPAVYDERLGRFCYARLAAGRFESTSVPVTSAPPAGVHPHEEESAAVRAQRIDERRAHLDRAAGGSPAGGGRDRGQEQGDERDLR